jgi:flagellar biosynthesis protein FlhG
MVNLLPVASGKGGVGKSALAVNLAILLARKQKKIILVDFDLGGANLHTLLGLKNNHAGLGNFIYKQTDSLKPLLQETGIENLQFIAGDCLYPGTPNLSAGTKAKIIKNLNSLDADYVILDLGAGTTYNTLDMYLLTYNSLLVTTPELTSILNAYSFLKAAAYRFFMRQFKTKSLERITIDSFLKASTTGTESSFLELIKQITDNFPEPGKAAENELRKYRPQVIVNMGQTAQDLEMARKLRTLVQNKLGLTMDFIGFVPKDDHVSLAVARRTPLAVSDPDCAFVKAAEAAVNRILLHSYSYNNMNILETDDARYEKTGEDLTTLNSEFAGA